jgi:AcrR family transcriptional regulator
MPVETTITKDKVLKAAFELVRKEGEKAFSARKIASRLKCSTQPVYSSFKNMKALEQAVIEESMQYVIRKYLLSRKDKMQFFSFGLGFIEIAKQEPELFNFLFLSGKITVSVENDNWPLSDDKLKAAILKDASLTGLEEEAFIRVFRRMTIFSYGLTALINSNPDVISDEFIYQSLYEMGEIVIDWELNKREFC